MRSASSSGLGLGVGIAGGPTLAATQQGQGVAALIVMLAILCFIFAYCCWGGPFIRSLCRRHCCCHLEEDETESRYGSSEQTMGTAPTIILLPHGRMLVVDGTIFTQFQADTTGLDLVELGENVLRAQRNPRCLNRHQLQNSQGSILEMDVETPSKDSMGSIGGFPPPAYESIYGKDEDDMPPSYSDILLHRFANLPYEIDIQDDCSNSKEDIEMHSLESCPAHIINNPINNIPYHPYATVTSYSSQSYPRRNITRHSSLITTNQIGDFYTGNEADGVYAISNVNVPNNNFNHGRLSVDELQLNSGNSMSHLMLNDGEINGRIRLEENQHIQDDESMMGIMRSEIMSQDDGRNLQFRSLNDVTVSIDVTDDEFSGRTSRQAMRQDQNIPDENNHDEDDNDFGALADIRESRV